jgi:hypothetical protein
VSQKTVTVELTRKEIDALLRTCEFDPEKHPIDEFNAWVSAGEKIKQGYQTFLKEK